MLEQKSKLVEEKHKKLMIQFLYFGAFTILFSGFFFCAFSVMNDIHLKVLNTSIPGFVFGLPVIYFGIKLYFRVTKFKTELMKNHYIFNWNNFKIKKQVKLKKLK